MKVRNDIAYRFLLAEGFLCEAEEDLRLKRWRSCVSGSNLCIDNCGIAVLMLFGVSRTTHHPEKHLPQLLAEGTVSEEVGELIRELLPELELHDSHEKMLAKYGRETAYQSPWDIFTEEQAAKACEGARKSLALCRKLRALLEDGLEG
ncbi:MAG: HEPN domain-containing protein [Chlorobium sp.]|uniref:HEPN domain-containing protein n=1 Tax=Chlorobium sp. TaxID=1095 RepID=UPI0025C186F1|nr:HEPN domain-containing protein [Chlorobium sp.]MCF8383854.1 HEPN domain-containing protein [Chlorobium sp.]